MAQLKNLIVNGVSRFVGNLYGNIVGTVNGFTIGKSVPSDAKFTDTVYSHPTSSGNKHIPSGGSSGQILRWSADGTAAWGSDNNTTYSVATQSAQGLMSAADKKKLDEIASGAQVNAVTSVNGKTGAVTIGTGHTWTTTKGTTSSGASSTNPAVVVETYKNGNNWYRVWSDGWIEQGGWVSTTSSPNNSKTVTLHKAFSNTTYCLLSQENGYSDSALPHKEAGAFKSRSTTSFVVALPDSSHASGRVWYAAGY